MDDLQTKVCIIGSGPAAHTAAIYVSRAELKPILFECWMANGIALGSSQSHRFGTQIMIETVNKVDFSTTPFKIFADFKTVIAESIIVATSVIAKQAIGG